MDMGRRVVMGTSTQKYPEKYEDFPIKQIQGHSSSDPPEG
jgi:hypothetical protein